jgi:ABC-type molybdenum transport system ATPase subunit/photorepair protein PhrA
MRGSLVLQYVRKYPKANITGLPPVVKIENGTFYKHHPHRGDTAHKQAFQIENARHDDANPPMFPGLNFSVKAKDHEEYWAIIGPSNTGKTTFLDVLSGQFICLPPSARQYANLYDHDPRATHRATGSKPIQYVRFDAQGSSIGGGNTKGAYMSARYESRREETDFTVWNFLIGNTNLNPDAKELKEIERVKRQRYLRSTIEKLRLSELLNLPVSNLSNGQTRRAKIGRALIANPKLLLLDDPFLGLDPKTKQTLSPMFWSMSRRAGPALVVTLLDNDEIPRWITHLLYLGPDHQIWAQGPKYAVAESLKARQVHVNIVNNGPGLRKREAGHFQHDPEVPVDVPKIHVRRGVAAFRWFNVSEKLKELDEMKAAEKETIVEMQGVRLRYGGESGQCVIGQGQQSVDGELRDGLWWNIRRGERWGLFGPNGSGKTTLLSLIASDHPQAYSTPVKMFGRSRLPTPSQPGISIFDLQSRMGQASPEIHHFFPRNLTIRQTIESAWAETFISRPSLDHEADEAVDAVLRWFQHELNPSLGDDDPADLMTHKPYLGTTTEPTKPGLKVREELDAYFSINLEWADEVRFGESSFSSQRVALFLRAVIKKPDLVILDEAFSGLDEYTRIKCMMFLSFGETVWLRPEKTGGFSSRSVSRALHDRHMRSTVSGLEPRQALINVSHRQDEVPPIVQQWLCLPEANSSLPARFGDTPFRELNAWQNSDWWEEIWQVSKPARDANRRRWALRRQERERERERQAAGEGDAQ